jgi:hypothetical protein
LATPKFNLGGAQFLPLVSNHLLRHVRQHVLGRRKIMAEQSAGNRHEHRRRDPTRQSHRMEEAAAILTTHKKYIEMLATFPHELVKPANAAAATVEAASRPTAAKVGCHSKGAHKA